jgi:hypothetical protein
LDQKKMRRSPEERFELLLKKVKEGEARAKDRRKKRKQNRKIRLKKSYKEAKKWLDQVKSKSGCCFCGERDARVLSFYPREGEKIKFLPVLANRTRSRPDWKRVLASCDIVCHNCGARKGLRQNPGRPRKVRKLGVNALPRHNPHISRPNQCGCCRRPLAKVGQKFCSPRCRLLSWAAQQILSACRMGQADGLRETISKIAAASILIPGQGPRKR